MRPIASARPGNVNVFVNNRRYIKWTIRASKESFVPKKSPIPVLKEKPKDMILVFFLKDLFLIFEEGCLDCFKENLIKDID